ncbi:hypothetical protein [Cedecea sp. NFIX57]|uniref:hypothetical protein n=1 Tax=Cedecea sp. NFIX57 TaxID=1566286 RepID=UPI000A0EC8E7|nr:hypothetical protein [Cedecea sp. NFIX57]SMG59863.1 hypothetical protein SAMN03159353_103234 [Cedecea sp. NFIX57]
MYKTKRNPEQRIRSLRQEQARCDRRLTVWLEAGLALGVATVVSWTLSQQMFGAAFSVTSTDRETLLVQGIWNVLMYFVPGSLFALTAGCFAVGALNALGACLADVRCRWLTRRLRHDAALQPGGDKPGQ